MRKGGEAVAEDRQRVEDVAARMTSLACIDCKHTHLSISFTA